MKQHNRTRRGAVVVASMLLSLAAQASNMSFYGTLVELAPCTVNNGENMKIEFDDIKVGDVNGVNYNKIFSVPLRCDANTKIVLKHLGTATSFNSAAVQTNIADFGIQLSELHSQEGKATPITVGKSVLLFDGQEVPKSIVLGAIPVKKNGAKLKTGNFTGVSTLQLEYP
ncbi:fimbrial protein [Serratia silvae]|uniref:Fimbrial protein n=1 Tax=Serratia silvae TaxID=2824122 RepID=A0ABT0KA38_9GAMM|nr:fimbrial protein [Serratia silvae]MCL1028816.1 fimbrial protein [Serratia silvae]